MTFIEIIENYIINYELVLCFRVRCRPQSTNIDVKVGMYRKLFLVSEFLEYISQYKLISIYKISDSGLKLNVFRKSEVT